MSEPEPSERTETTEEGQRSRRFPARPARVKLVAAERKFEGEEAWIETTLFYDGKTYVGRSASVLKSDAAGGTRRSVLATMHAIEQLVAGQFQMELDRVDRNTMFDREFVCVLVKVTFEGKTFELYGTCLSGEDVTLTAARATLDALNRYVEIALHWTDW